MGRWSLRIVAALVLLLLLFYAGLLALMTFTERSWLGDPPFHEAIDARSSTPHDITLIDDGALALAYRLQLIESAQRTLEVEYFIYDLDRSSRVVTQALAARAAAGVKVRVLVDFSLPVLALRPVYAQTLRDAGIDVRYYNTASVARLFSVQHRTHRKLLIADGEAAIIGGRNIADEYFDLSPDYNFLDSDALVRGEVVAAMRESFDLYWDSPWARTLDARTAATDDGARDAEGFLVPTVADRAVAQAARTLPLTLPVHQCGDVRFVTDYPGLAVRNRQVYNAIVDLLAEAKAEVLAESPYFVLRGDGLDALQSLTDRGVRLSVLTNSLYSTDAYYTVGPLFFSLAPLQPTGMHLYAYSGGPPEPVAARSALFSGSERWGVHSKRAVIDDATVLLGTYNIDPRSANLNSELILVCRDAPALAAVLRRDLEARMARSEPVLDGATLARRALLGRADWRDQLVMLIVAPVASAFDILL
ncbi:MAG: phosphatidylserine/phosphatidylglycerophosphate/cardiolipin synthase family protein [Pseudomonadota bacterium]